ncbi:MAG: CinA family protein, partial [Limosilactobacillus sp.]|nr:CinA family protein [Limosilactobacillus sp.]
MDQQVTASDVVKLLSERQLTISAAESLTAGMLMSELASVPGASKVLLGGFVTYATAFKTKLLGIPAELIASAGVVSEATAMAMA